MNEHDGIVNLGQKYLNNFHVENDYVHGFIEGDENYEPFLRNFNNVCGGFVVRDSHSWKKEDSKSGIYAYYYIAIIIFIILLWDHI